MGLDGPFGDCTTGCRHQGGYNYDAFDFFPGAFSTIGGSWVLHTTYTWTDWGSDSIATSSLWELVEGPGSVTFLDSVPSVTAANNDRPANNATVSAVHIPWYKNSCVMGALGRGDLSVGIDAIGFIPEAEGVTKVFENEAGYQLARAVGNSAGYRGVVATQYGMKAVAQGKGAAVAISSAFGLGDTSVQGRISTGLTVAGFIPGLGSLAAGASIVNDAIKTGMAIAQCR